MASKMAEITIVDRFAVIQFNIKAGQVMGYLNDATGRLCD